MRRFGEQRSTNIGLNLNMLIAIVRTWKRDGKKTIGLLGVSLTELPFSQRKRLYGNKKNPNILLTIAC